MNLLKDKREQERWGDFQDLTHFPADDLEPPAASPTSATVKKNRGSLLPLLAVFVVIGAVAAGYYLLIDKSSQPAPKPAQVEQVMPSKPVVPQPSDSAVEVAETPIETQAQVQAEAQPAVATDSETSIGAAARLMTALLSAVKSDDRIGSIFFDEGAFSAEITSTSVESAKAVYAALGDAAKNVVFTSEVPTGSSLLLTGTFIPATVSEIASGPDLEDQVKALAQQSGLTLATITVSGAPRLMYIKMNGPLSSCRDFLVLFARQNIRVNISKIIIMPAQANDYTFVLRLLV